MSYEYTEWPAWVSNAAGEQRLVQSEAEFSALGEGWQKPAQPTALSPQEQPGFAEYPKWVNGEIAADAEAEAEIWARDNSNTRESLIQLAADKGIKIDKRWSDDKIQAAIDAGSATA